MNIGLSHLEAGGRTGLVQQVEAGSQSKARSRNKSGSGIKAASLTVHAAPINCYTHQTRGGSSSKGKIQK